MTRLRLFVCTLLVMLAPSGCGGAGVARSSAADWRLEFSVSGGIDGRVQSLTVRADGHLLAQDQRRALRFERQLDDATRERLARLVAAAPNTAGSAPGRPLARPCPDCIQYQLDISADGRRQRVLLDTRTLPASPHGELVRVLTTLLRQSLSEPPGATGGPTLRN